MTKICTKCGEEKRIKPYHSAEFWRDKRQVDGYAKMCSACTHALNLLRKSQSEERRRDKALLSSQKSNHSKGNYPFQTKQKRKAIRAAQKRQWFSECLSEFDEIIRWCREERAHTKGLLVGQSGLRYADIPSEFMELKRVQFKITKFLKGQEDGSKKHQRVAV